jgi:hypothetical protein
MNRNLRQFIVQSNREATIGIALPADVAPREAVAARRRDDHNDLLGVGRRAEKEKGVWRRWQTLAR